MLHLTTNPGATADITLGPITLIITAVALIGFVIFLPKAAAPIDRLWRPLTAVLLAAIAGALGYVIEGIAREQIHEAAVAEWVNDEYSLDITAAEAETMLPRRGTVGEPVTVRIDGELVQATLVRTDGDGVELYSVSTGKPLEPRDS